MELGPRHFPTIRTVNTWQAGASGTPKLLLQREGHLRHLKGSPRKVQQSQQRRLADTLLTSGQSRASLGTVPMCLLRGQPHSPIQRQGSQ